MRRAWRSSSWLVGFMVCGIVAAAPARVDHHPARGAARPAAATLHIEEFGSTDSTAFYVTSTLIIGPTEVMLWDAQYHVSDARRLADRIAATGKHLTAIVISHPDHDHYMGASTIVERFPGTPVYMTAAALDEYKRTAAANLKGEQTHHAAEAPDSLVTPQVLPSMHLTVDGEAVEVVPDEQGDVVKPTNSFLWIPSLHTVLAADVAFNGIHPWLGSSDHVSRTRWHGSLDRIAGYHPAKIVAGHKRYLDAPDTRDVLAFMDRYLNDFDAAVQAGPDGDAVMKTMVGKYPALADRMLLNYSAHMAFRPPPATQ